MKKMLTTALLLTICLSVYAQKRSAPTEEDIVVAKKLKTSFTEEDVVILSKEIEVSFDKNVKDGFVFANHLIFSLSATLSVFFIGEKMELVLLQRKKPYVEK